MKVNRYREPLQIIINSWSVPWRPNQIPSAALFGRVCEYLAGTYRREEDKSFDTEEHGVVSHTDIGRICVDKFGAEAKRTNTTRFFEFNRERLDKAKSAYVFPKKVEILPLKDVIEEGDKKEQEELEDGEQKSREPEIIKEKNVGGPDSDVSDVNLPFRSRLIEEHDEDVSNLSRIDSTGAPAPQREGTSSFPTKENSLYTFKEENTSHSSPQGSKELFQLVDDNEHTNPFVKVIQKAIRYRREQNASNNDDGSFWKEDYVWSP